ARSGLKEAPTSWTEGLTRMLTSRSQELLSDVVATARSVRVPENQAKDMAVALLIVASDVHAPVDVRLIALAPAPGRVARVERPLVSLLCEQLEPGRPVATRSLAAEVLSRARLTSEQLLSLTNSLKSIGPLELDRVVEAFGQSADEEVGLKLIEVLRASP